MCYDLKAPYTSNTNFILVPLASTNFLLNLSLITFLIAAPKHLARSYLKGGRVCSDSAGYSRKGMRQESHRGGNTGCFLEVWWIECKEWGIMILCCSPVSLPVQFPSLQDGISHNQDESSGSANPLWKSLRRQTPKGRLINPGDVS